MESHAFPGYNSRKVKTFRGLYRRKACNHKLFCAKTAFPMVKSAESQNFPRIILRKGMTFRRIISGKSKLYTDYTAERHAFPLGYQRKVKTFRELPCGKFQYTAESFSIPLKVKISLFKGLSLLPQIIFDKKSTMGDQCYPRF
jgi:hypothetical protein